MPRLTALLHTHNDALRLGRCLETVYPCDDILIFDHHSDDDSLRIAGAYGAKIIRSNTRLAVLGYEKLVSGWLLCLRPCESLTESLAASLYEWKTRSASSVSETSAYSLHLREETTNGWIDHENPQTRLVPANWRDWHEDLPVHDPSAQIMAGPLFRFAFP